MSIEISDRDKTMKEAGEILKRWRKAKKALSKRADELSTEADRIKRDNPGGAAVLRHRSIKLRDEVNRMAAESKKGIPGDKLKRSALMSELALLVDESKK